MKFKFEACNDNANLEFTLELSEFDEICIDTRIKFNDEFVKFEKLAEKLFHFNTINIVEVKVFEDLDNFDKVYEEWDIVGGILSQLEEGSKCFTEIVEHLEKIQSWHYSESIDFEMSDMTEKFKACRKLFDNLFNAVNKISLPDGF